MRLQSVGFSAILILGLFWPPEMFWWGNRVVTRVPDLGDSMPCEPIPQFGVVVSSAQIASACLVFFGGVQIEVATISGSQVDYLAVDDSRFETAEGIHAGSKLEEVLATGAREPWSERGWAFHTRLASGWEAAFTHGKSFAEEPLPCKSEVQWLFKR